MKSKVDKLTVFAIIILIVSITTALVLCGFAYYIWKNSQNEKPKEYKQEIFSLEEYRKQSDEQEKEGKDTIEVPDVWVDTSCLVNKSICMDVEFISQNPELPTGCEITSLATVLKYYGYDISKTELAEKYLRKKSAPADWRKVFVGDPTDPHSFGCYSYPIVEAANRYLKENGYNHYADNISGCGFLDVLSEVDSGNPVVIWGTMGLSQGVKTIEWEVDGEKMRWIAPEHCMVFIGYDLEKSEAIISDPQKGIVRYNIRKLKQSFETMYSQCIVIRDNDGE